VVYTLDFTEAGKMRGLFEKHGIKDAEVLQMTISKLNAKNTFDTEPSPWIVYGRRERED
jgi:precorrin-6Y C5,15-methyltransferase (decarboxylating)